MRARRAGCGGAPSADVLSGPVSIAAARRAVAPVDGQRIRLGDDPRIAAAIRYARLDVAAYEQSERYWLAVWGAS